MIPVALPASVLAHINVTVDTDPHAANDLHDARTAEAIAALLPEAERADLVELCNRLTTIYGGGVPVAESIASEFHDCVDRQIHTSHLRSAP